MWILALGFLLGAIISFFGICTYLPVVCRCLVRHRFILLVPLFLMSMLYAIGNANMSMFEQVIVFVGLLLNALLFWKVSACRYHKKGAKELGGKKSSGSSAVSVAGGEEAPALGSIQLNAPQKDQLTKEEMTEGLNDYQKIWRHTLRQEGKNAAFMEKVDKYLDTYIESPQFQTSDLCMEFGLSRAQLYRRIKAVTGVSVSKYIRYYKVKKAYELLLANQYSIKEIAFKTGFSSPSYFSRTFVEFFDEPPSSKLSKSGCILNHN